MRLMVPRFFFIASRSEEQDGNGPKINLGIKTVINTCTADAYRSPPPMSAGARNLSSVSSAVADADAADDDDSEAEAIEAKGSVGKM